MFGKSEKTPMLAAGVHNPLGARLAEEAGFDAVWLSGLELSAAAGVPDADILTLSDFLDAARRIVGATKLSVVCDCNAGFGNAQNVFHMTREYERAGVSAICIEDKVFPKLNSFISGRQRLASITEFTGKVRAAAYARTRADIAIIARIEAFIAGYGLPEVLSRAVAYADAGADALLVHSKDASFAPLRAFCEEWNGRLPLVFVPTAYPQITASELAKLGARLVIYANHGLRASISAIAETFAEIVAQGSTVSVDKKIAPLSRVFTLQRMDEFMANEEKFVPVGGAEP